LVLLPITSLQQTKTVGWKELVKYASAKMYQYSIIFATINIALIAGSVILRTVSSQDHHFHAVWTRVADGPFFLTLLSNYFAAKEIKVQIG